MEAYAINPF